MKRKGFTLIELLAVIVILAIIALIATPIILNIISDSKEESNKRSVELYGKAVEQAIAKSQLNGTEVQAGDLSEEFLETVQYSGSEVTCTTNKLYEDGSIYLEGCNGEYTYGVRQYAYMWPPDSEEYVYVEGPSIGDDASILSTSVPTDKDYYLKFKLDSDNKVIEGYACIVYGDSRKEVCLRGGSTEFYGYAKNEADYTGNLLILKGLQSEGFSCSFYSVDSHCGVDSFSLDAGSSGFVDAGGGDGYCAVNDGGGSFCESL